MPAWIRLRFAWRESGYPGGGSGASVDCQRKISPSRKRRQHTATFGGNRAACFHLFGGITTKGKHYIAASPKKKFHGT